LVGGRVCSHRPDGLDGNLLRCGALANSYSDANSNGDGNADCYSNSDCDSSAFADADCNTWWKDKSNATAAPNATASPLAHYSKVDTTEFDGCFPGGAPE